MGRLENIEELMNKIVAYEQNCEEEPTLAGFLEEVSLVADIDSLAEEEENGSNYVVLMTLHSTKGLEFPTVFLCGMEDGLFPGYLSISSDDPSDLEEERRLCYVGITRAMERLYLSSSRLRMVRGDLQFNEPSRFLREIPRYLLHEIAPLHSGYTSHSGYSSQASYTGSRTSSGMRTFHQAIGRGNSGANKNRQPGQVVSQTNPMSRPADSRQQAADKQASRTKADGLFAGNPYIQKGFGALSSSSQQTSPIDYQAGDRVRHIKFGLGTVTALAPKNSAKGTDMEVTVEFDSPSVGTRKMLASFAKLQKQS